MFHEHDVYARYTLWVDARTGQLSDACCHRISWQHKRNECMYRYAGTRQGESWLTVDCEYLQRRVAKNLFYSRVLDSLPTSYYFDTAE